ncbi:hypothetical protein QP519_03050 [Weeksella virosa]|uniref:hypothetical protein n=1 Tax=Weeksella virosa TaxID=1014 RepID=UPI002555FEFF|nr:hypothetical protein [Weeksella virosa]MDK7374514.1 hypothetical protein [Weeksella virosa]
MITLDRMNSLEDLKYAKAYEQVENYREGEKAAIAYFKNIYEENDHDEEWSDDMVDFYGPKKFRTHDYETNVTTETTVYESYVDSGSVDYFFFSYETEL